MGWNSLFLARSGNAAMMFCIAAPALLLLVGLGIDFSVKQNARTTLQNALDSALLAAARAEDQDGRDAIAAQFARENFAAAYGGHSLSLTLATGDENELTGAARVVVPNFFGGLFGAAESEIRVDAAVLTNSPPLEIMLVLDKTGSMAGPKIAALRSAATDLVNEVMDGEHVKVGVAPFARYVNIGMSLRNEPGFDIPADETSCAMETVTEYVNPRNCRQVTGTCNNDGVPYSCSWQECDHDTVQTQQNVCRTREWRGCVGSRQSPLNARDASTGTPVPGVLDRGCGANPLTRLTADKGRVTDAIAALSPDGETYIPAGLMMGWHALSHRPILPDGTDPDSVDGRRITRAIVLMTDGANTASQSGTTPYHDDGDSGQADLLTRALCDNVKEDGVKLYTVAFDVADANIRSILRQCATTPADAYDAADAAELSEAFQAIAASLTRLRISR